MFVTIKEYAKLHGYNYDYVRKAISKKLWEPDYKIKNQWYVDSDKPWYTHNHKINLGLEIEKRIRIGCLIY